MIWNKQMIKPELFDIIELLVNLPEQKQLIGNQGAIVECLDDKYEIEFTNKDGDTIAQCALSTNQFLVVWRAKSKQWVSISERIDTVIDKLSDDKKQEVLNYVRFLYQSI